MRMREQFWYVYMRVRLASRLWIRRLGDGGTAVYYKRGLGSWRIRATRQSRQGVRPTDPETLKLRVRSLRSRDQSGRHQIGRPIKTVMEDRR